MRIIRPALVALAVLLTVAQCAYSQTPATGLPPFATIIETR